MTGLDDEGGAELGYLIVGEGKRRSGGLWDNDGVRELEPVLQQGLVHAGFIEGGLRGIGRVDDLGGLVMSEKNEAVINIIRQMMLAVHIQEHAGPDFVTGIEIVEAGDPERLDQEEIQAPFRAMTLDPMNEEIIGIQFVGHY